MDCPKRIDDLTDRSLRLDADGHPRIAYGGDCLYYAWYDGTTWHHETVDSSAGVGRFASLDLAQDGQPHIAYYDSPLSRLLYAYRDATGWQVEIVETGVAADWAANISLALDPGSQPHIAYKRGDALQYAYRQVGMDVWLVETVDPTDGNHASLALDTRGRPHIGYGQEIVKYAYRDAGGWHVETIDDYADGWASLALDAEGYPHLSYRGWDDGWGFVYAYADAGGWHREFVIGESIWRISLALDSSGSPHMSYSSYANGPELHYAHRAQSGWQIETIDHNDALEGWHYWSSVAVDSAGSVHIVFHGSDLLYGADLDRRLAYAHALPSGWQTDTIDSDAVAGIGVSLAFDASGYPHLSYQGNGLRHAYLDATGWHFETLDVLGSADTSLGLDASGQIRVAYTAYYDKRGRILSGPVEIKAGRAQATDWQAEIVDRPWNDHPSVSLALSPDGWPGFTYHSSAYPNNTLCYAYQDSAGWHIDRVDRFNESVSSLVIGADHVPRIAYPSHGLRYAVRSPTGWQAETAVAQVGVPDAISLALDGSGFPAIAYYQSASSADGDLMLARRDAAGWHVETVDTAGDVGLAASLALDASGAPHIAYYDKSNQDLKYATKDAAGWHVEIVDALGNAGQYASIALDGAGHVCIAYYDAVMSDLKLACQGRTSS